MSVLSTPVAVLITASISMDPIGAVAGVDIDWVPMNIFVKVAMYTVYTI